MSCEVKGKDWISVSKGQGMLRIAHGRQKLGKQRGTGSPSKSLQVNNPADILISDSGPPELGNNTFLLFSARKLQHASM